MAKQTGGIDSRSGRTFSQSHLDLCLRCAEAPLFANGAERVSDKCDAI